MNTFLRKKLVSFFKKHPSIKLVYFFGSRARNEAGPLSDYDFAVYSDRSDTKELNQLRLGLIAGLCRILKTNAVDVVMLNAYDAPELKYAIITEGILLYEKKPYALMVEPAILNDYFDFTLSLKKHHLTHGSSYEFEDSIGK